MSWYEFKIGLLLMQRRQTYNPETSLASVLQFLFFKKFTGETAVFNMMN
jgi:hypothetical protein